MTHQPTGVHVLQRLAWPIFPHEPLEDLYAHCANALLSRADRRVRIQRGGYVGFHTYFNVFSLGKWLRLTPIADVGVRIRLHTGRAFVRVCGIHPDYNTILAEADVHAGTAPIVWLPADRSTLEASPLAFVECFCTEDAEIDAVDWVTTTPPLRHSTFAVVITTFNREAEVARAVNVLADDSDFRHYARIIVVNNGDPIALRQSEYVRVVDNPNLGGAGGFMRGLLEARETGRFTHALFLDDDAVCPPVAVHRIKALVDWARDPQLTVGGAMLYLSHPWIQYECSARLDGLTPTPVNLDMDLRSRDALLANDRVEYGAYGPWWLFAFPLRADLKLAFPFFVRGDDITFSLRNGFRPLFLNGVASWQESFDDKISPVVEYLTLRSLILIALVYATPPRRARQLAGAILHRIASELLGYRYGIAEALCEAVADVLAGPDFWRRNVDMSRRLREVADRAGPLRVASVDPHAIHAWDGPERRWRRCVRLATLNGHLLPRVLCRRRGPVVPGLSTRPVRAAFHREIAQLARTPGRLYSFARDDRRLVTIAWRTVRLCAALVRRHAALVAAYQAALPEFESEAFWRAEFARRDGTAQRGAA